MRSPRHRWNLVAPTVPGLEPFKDGLTFPAFLDPISADLQAFLKGKKHKNTLLDRAYRLYQSDSGRTLFDSVLFSTGSVGATAEITHESTDLVQAYADCFFDVTVFEGMADKIVFLDRMAALDPQAAQIMRNTLDLSTDSLRFLSDKSRAAKIDPKTALESGLTFYATLFQVFQTTKLEPHMLNDKQAKEDFDWTFRHANTCSAKMLAFSHELLAFELDKSAENFLAEFVMKLAKRDDRDLISDKSPEGPELF